MTNNQASTSQPTSDAIRYYIGLAVLYTLLVFLLPASQRVMHQYQLSPLEYRCLVFVIELPIMAVWFAAFYGYSKLRQYANTIAKTAEGKHFSTLATGCTWLAWSLPIPAILALILNSIADSHPAFHPASIIINNYIGLVMALIAFSIIGTAAHGLVNQAKMRLSAGSVRAIVLFFVTAGVAYCYLTFRHFSLTSFGSTHNPYYLPVWLMVVSVIIPYLYAWFIGLLATYELNSYSRHVRGLLYKRPLRLLAGGLIAVIVSSIVLQYIGSIEPRVGRIVLDYKLVLTTLFRILGGIGYILIALGASRLKKIEDV